MTTKQLFKNVEDYIRREIRNGGELEDMYEWFCDEEGRDKNKRTLEYYFKRLMTNFYENLVAPIAGSNNSVSLADQYQDECDDAHDDMEDFLLDTEDEPNEQEYAENLAQMLSDRLENPFKNIYGYEWEPISYALNAMGLTDERGLRKIEGASAGQMLVLAYYIQGTDGELPWAWILNCVD